MPEVSADLAADSCFSLHSENAIQVNQQLAPDLFPPRAPARVGAHTHDGRRVSAHTRDGQRVGAPTQDRCVGAHTRDAGGRFAKGHSGNPNGRPRGIRNPKRRVVTLKAYRENPDGVMALARRKPRLMLPLLRQALPPARTIDPVERLGLRLDDLRTLPQIERALYRTLEAVARGEIAPAEAARFARRVRARLRAERRLRRIARKLDRAGRRLAEAQQRRPQPHEQPRAAE